MRVIKVNAQFLNSGIPRKYIPTQTGEAAISRPQPRIFASTQMNARTPVGVDYQSTRRRICRRNVPHPL